MAEIDRGALAGRWLHSREEDREGETVYRPAGYDFPPARGRFGFELRPDGTYVELGPGPTDRPEEGATGRWELEDGDLLRLSPEGGAEARPVMRVISADERKLVLRE
jgi:hypothetical protein